MYLEVGRQCCIVPCPFVSCATKDYYYQDWFILLSRIIWSRLNRNRSRVLNYCKQAQKCPITFAFAVYLWWERSAVPPNFQQTKNAVEVRAIRSQSRGKCNDKVAKNIFWTGAGGPHLIGNFGEVPLTATSPKFRMRRGPPAPVQKIFFATLSLILLWLITMVDITSNPQITNHNPSHQFTF